MFLYFYRFKIQNWGLLEFFFLTVIVHLGNNSQLSIFIKLAFFLNHSCAFVLYPNSLVLKHTLILIKIWYILFLSWDHFCLCCNGTFILVIFRSRRISWKFICIREERRLGSREAIRSRISRGRRCLCNGE